MEDYPLIHTNNNFEMRPYNGSLFLLKGTYNSVFGDLENEHRGKDTKFYKIKYTLNLLPSIAYDEEEKPTLMNDLMEMFGQTEELGIFKTKVVNDFFEFQWNTYAKHLHYFGGTIHLIYVLLFTCYVQICFNDRNFEWREELCWGMLICLIYPFIYDGL
jgi:hypothetical protein